MKDVEDEESDDEDEVEGDIWIAHIGRHSLTHSLSFVAHIEEASEESESNDEDDEDDARDPDSGERNSHLTVGHKSDRTFVVRGEKIGVFKNGNGSKIEYAATIRNLGFKEKKAFKPKDVGSLWCRPVGYLTWLDR